LEDLLKSKEIWVSIHDISLAPPSCASPIVAEGTGQMVVTDNHLPGPAPDPGPRTSSFGFNSQGTLALTAGGCANYNIRLRFAIHPGDAFVPRSGDITLHPVANDKC
jgi:hypothetical protein